MEASDALASAPVAETASSVLPALQKAGEVVLWLLTPDNIFQMMDVWKATGQW